MVNARLATQEQLRYVPHTSVTGETWTFQRKGETSGAGSASGTTLVDSQIGGSDDDYNGRYWIHILSGTNKGEWKRIVDYTSSSGTCTFENNGFTNQVASGVEYELWLSPEPVAVVDSSSGETDMVDAVRAEADDFWNDYYAIPITGSHRGKIAKITDFTSSTGTFTLESSFGSALTAGDVVLIGRFVEPGSVSNGLTQGYQPRPMNRVNFAVGDGTVGAKAGTFGFNVQVTASGTLVTSAGTIANPSVLSGLFEAAGLEESIGKAVDVDSGSTVSAIEITSGQRENLDVGQMVIHQGNATFITSLDDGGASTDTVNVTPPLPTAPTSGDVLSPARSYHKSTDGDVYGCVLEHEQDGVRTTMTGCKGNVSLQQGEQVLELALNYNVDHYVREIEAAPYNAGTAYTTAAAILHSEREAWLNDGTESARTDNKVDIKGFTASPNTAVTPKGIQGSAGINGRSGFQLTGYSCGGTFRELLDASGDLDAELRWTARSERDLAVIYGSHGDCFAVRLPAARHIEVPKPEGAEGMLETPDVFEAQDAGTASDGSDTQKVFDWSMHFS